MDPEYDSNWSVWTFFPHECQLNSLLGLELGSRAMHPPPGMCFDKQVALPTWALFLWCLAPRYSKQMGTWTVAITHRTTFSLLTATAGGQHITSSLRLFYSGIFLLTYEWRSKESHLEELREEIHQSSRLTLQPSHRGHFLGESVNPSSENLRVGQDIRDYRV